MRIAFIGPFGMEPKSTMRVRALPLASSLAKRGHQMALFLPPFHTPEAAGRRWQENGVTIENVSLNRWPLLGYGITAWRLVQRAIAWRPSIIHCFKPKGYSGLALWFLWWWQTLSHQKVRLVLDSDDWEGWGGWNELEPYPGWQKRFFARQEKWGMTHADLITVASRALETIVWSLGTPPSRVTYLPNGADRLPDSPVPQPPATSCPTILLYTRFFEFDVRRVVTLLQQVRERVQTAQLLVVGKGLFGEETQLMEEVAAAGLQGAVEYVGWVSAEQLPGYFAAAHCAIYPFSDTLINRTKCAVKLKDMLAAGVPVVAEAVGQNQEYIQHGRSGLLVHPGDEAGFASAVVRLLRDEGLRATLAAGARRRIATEFTWDHLAVRVEQAYQRQ
jgi:glycosyltransferase involved in cell wall biosynthesis